MANPDCTLHWVITDHRDGPTARAEWAGLLLYVSDHDGDLSAWEIRKGRNGKVMAYGEVTTGDHFKTAIRKAELALASIIRRRLIELREARGADRPADIPRLMPEERILAGIQRKYGVTRDELMQFGGPRTAPHARAEAMAALRSELDWSGRDIAAFFGVTPSTVSDLIKKLNLEAC